MSKIDNAIYEIHDMDDMAAADNPIMRMHPLIKLVVTLAYIIIVVSFSPYELSGIIPMILYPVLIFTISEVGFIRALRKLRIVLPLVCFVGVLNIFFDQTPIFRIGSVIITTGVVSACTITIKGILAVFASFLLVATTGIDKICYALRLLHVPKLFIMLISLMYRYITVLLAEANHIFCAYSLRAPGQKGIHYKIWGPLIGQLLLRSMDRANSLYDSMVLRGYNGEFYVGEKIPITIKDVLYGVVWIGLFLFIRNVQIARLIGSLIM